MRRFSVGLLAALLLLAPAGALRAQQPAPERARQHQAPARLHHPRRALARQRALRHDGMRWRAESRLMRREVRLRRSARLRVTRRAEVRRMRAGRQWGRSLRRWERAI